MQMSEDYVKSVKSRLSRVEGQIKGISAMVDEGRECEDIIVQLSAVNSAVTNIARMILEHHIEHCVVDGIKSSSEQETIENLKKAIAQFSKMK